MTRRTTYLSRARSFRRDETGATFVEFALVLALFLFILFGLIDFGRLAFHYVTAEKAMHVAARIASVRPPACAGVPEYYEIDPLNVDLVPPDFGTRCNDAGHEFICKSVSKQCSGDLANSTVAEIWPIVSATLPNDAGPENLLFRYDYDPNLGFLGGPYVPVVTVELQNVNFQFLGIGSTAGSTLAGLVELAGGTPSSGMKNGYIEFPALSVSMPAEDLADGMDG